MQKVSRDYHLMFWIGGVFLAPILFFFDFRQLDGIHLTQSHLIVGRDFLNVWTGGQLVLSDSLNILYDYQRYMEWQSLRFGPLDAYNYSYPPSSLFLAAPFGTLPYIAALMLWTILGAVFFYWAARPYMPQNLAPIFALLTPAALVNIWMGHYGFVIGGLWLLFFSSIERYPVRSGILAGLLTLKPHLGLLIAAVMLYRRMTLSIAVALLVTVTLVVASGWAFGFDLWTQWIFDTSALQARIMNAPGEKFYYLMMPSTYIALRNSPHMLAAVGQIIMAVAALILMWKARNASPKELAFVTASATALISPYIFNYDLTVASLGFVIFLYGKWDRLQVWEKHILWLAFASPLFVMAFNLFAPISLLAGLYVQTRHLEEGRRVRPSLR